MSQDWRPPGGGPDDDAPGPAAPAGGGWAVPGSVPPSTAPVPPAAHPPPVPPAHPAPQQWGQPTGSPVPPDLTKAPGPTAPPPPGYGYGYGQGAPVPPPVPLAPRPGVVPLRPLGLGEIYDGAFQVMRRNPAATIGWAALIGGLTTLMAVALQGLMGPELARLTDPATAATVSEDELADVFGVYGLGWMVTAAVTAIGLALLNGVLVVPVSRAVTGHRASFGDAWRAAWPRMGALLGLVGIGVLIGFGIVLLLLVPAFLAIVTPWLLLLYLLTLPAALLAGLWLTVRTSVATPAVMLERAGPVQAFRRVHALVGGLWTGPFWRSVGILVLASVIVGVASQVLAFPAFLVSGGIAFANPDDPLAAAGVAPLQLLVTALAGIVTSAVLYPFQAGVCTLLYVDHRIRREGLDVELARAAEQP